MLCKHMLFQLIYVECSLDWEYPTSTGAGCNAVSANDITNFAALVKEMRAALDSNFPTVHKELTLAVHLTPWGGATIVPDATAFTPYVDRFNVMSFGKLAIVMLYCHVNHD
jgi:chitinase